MARANQADEARFRAAAERLAQIGCFCRGTVLSRRMACGKAGCRCRADPPVLHGPYFQWTRKVRGKTVTVRVTEDQATLLRAWIAEGRRLDAAVVRLERLSAARIARALGRPTAPKKGET